MMALVGSDGNGATAVSADCGVDCHGKRSCCPRSGRISNFPVRPVRSMTSRSRLRRTGHRGGQCRTVRYDAAGLVGAERSADREVAGRGGTVGSNCSMDLQLPSLVGVELGSALSDDERI